MCGNEGLASYEPMYLDPRDPEEVPRRIQPLGQVSRRGAAVQRLATAKGRTRKGKMMKAEERFRWRDLAKSQRIQPYILEAVLRLFETSDDLLFDLDRQRRYISTIHLQPMECPFCDQTCSYYEAVHSEGYTIGSGCSDLRCAHCGKELIEVVPFIGDVRWAKKHKAPKQDAAPKAGA
jgi:hypothetical protein